MIPAVSLFIELIHLLLVIVFSQMENLELGIIKVKEVIRILMMSLMVLLVDNSLV